MPTTWSTCGRTSFSTLSIEVLPMPDQPAQVEGVARWRVVPSRSLVVLYRIPIERMSRLHRDDDWHRRLMVEKLRLPRGGRAHRQGPVGARPRPLPPLVAAGRAAAMADG
ncbi:MAG: hypothetical protein ACJLS2_12830 [Microcella pacifica]